MIKKAFVEQVKRDQITDWYSNNCEDAVDGFKQLGYKVKGFTPDKMEKLPLSKKTIIKGSIRTVNKALNLLGISLPPNLDIPQELKEYVNRNIWATTLGKVRKDKKNVFIKPLNYLKAFKGHVYYDDYRNWLTKDYPDDFPVLTQEIVDFSSEWRAYVLNKKIIDVINYSGSEYDKKPTLKILNEMVKKFKSRPAAFALDVGYIKRKNKKILSLVEINCSASLGNYGIPKLEYAKMCETRWFEMVSAG